MWSQEAEELLMMTAAVESDLGTYLYSRVDDSVGVFQMKPSTEKDIWENYINNRPNLKKQLTPFRADLALDLRYQIIIARVHYMRSKKTIPTQPIEMARFYKEVWNTSAGSATCKLAFRKYVFLCSF